MQPINKKPIAELGLNFIPDQHLPLGKDEFYLREEQRDKTLKHRALKAQEIEILVNNKNRADDWNKILVTERFDPELVRNCSFHGLIRIGDLDPLFLEHKDMRMAVGLYDSLILSCEIGSNVVIKNVSYLANYIIANNAILINIDEMLTTNKAKFGNGVLKDGEKESSRISLELGNENGKRKVYPFNSMLSADCYLWYKYRDDSELMNRLGELTDKECSHNRGFYGTVGERTIIKNCRVVKDVKIGSDAYIKGANKLKNLTINSVSEAHTQIGEGVELVNGIIGQGCRIFYGVKAVRFILGEQSQLKYGARLLNSFLGENSTISCCEVLNSLIFPGHEQHHNNSFLCAATLLGQSNIAAGATVGSNHNSRGADGEILAGRGFWPGLCTNFKHFSRFASFCLVSKGTYHNELNITLPFALVSNDDANNSLQIMPAYWFMYNMYAMARNPQKFRDRDKRIKKDLLFEFDYLAPDTISEMFSALDQLKLWVANSFLGSTLSEGRERVEFKRFLEKGAKLSHRERLEFGELLLNDSTVMEKLTVYGEDQESSARPTYILKADKGFIAYKEMILFYGARELINWLGSLKSVDASLIKSDVKREEWTNIGGQLIPSRSLKHIKSEIKMGSIDSWEELHTAWGKSGKRYREERRNDGIASLFKLGALATEKISNEDIIDVIGKAIVVSDKIANETRRSREKDYSNPFRNITFESDGERDAVLGKLEDNSFIQTSQEDAKQFREKADILIKRLTQSLA